mgnify:CR=1 FL=1
MNPGPGCPMIGSTTGEDGLARTTEWSEDETLAIVGRHAGREGPLMPILHDVQATWGFVPRDAVPVIARALNLSRAEVWGVVTFYHDFRHAPAGRHVLKLCRAEACQANGCEQVVDDLRAEHGIDADNQDDERLTIETVYCLGNCALGPNALVDGEPVARLDADRLSELCAGVGAER